MSDAADGGCLVPQVDVAILCLKHVDEQTTLVGSQSPGQRKMVKTLDGAIASNLELTGKLLFIAWEKECSVRRPLSGLRAASVSRLRLPPGATKKLRVKQQKEDDRR
jgi:hypothetical protein